MLHHVDKLVAEPQDIPNLLLVLSSTTLTLDLGSRTGYAVGFQGTGSASLMQDAIAGTWELLSNKEARAQRKRGLERLGDARYYRLRDKVLDLCRVHQVSRIVFEDVKFCRSSLQTQLWSSLRAALWEVKDRLGVELRAVPTSTLKSFACSNPQADKAEMESALRARERTANDFSLGDDNEIDARWLLLYALAVDGGSRGWAFGWQLKAKQKMEAKNTRAQRRLEKGQRMARVREDGFSRLCALVGELGESLAPTAAHKAVTGLCRDKTLTLKLRSHVIKGSVLKNGKLSWKSAMEEDAK